MNAEASLSTPRRASWTRIVVVTWAGILSLVVAVNSVGLSRLSDRVHETTRTGQIEHLTEHMATLEQRVAAVERGLAAVNQANPGAEIQSLRQRLDEFEAAQVHADQAAESRALLERVQRIEARLGRLRSPAPTAAPRPRPAPPGESTPPEPPFDVVGVELRGGERYLAISPKSATDLPRVRLLRQGDTEAGWKLDAIEATGGVFRMDGRLRRIPVQ
ncbi:MAG: hypothetical protein KGZ43_10590 [Sulfuritalea sp.]|nr:hypothetical protein [Sulfuritalea sp.]